MKKGGALSQKSVSSLSSDEIEEIYQTYWVMYSKGLAHIVMIIIHMKVGKGL